MARRKGVLSLRSLLHKLMGSGRLLRLFSTAVLDQVLLSSSSFAVGLLLIRFTSDRDYGVYILVQSALILLSTAQGAWLAQPQCIVAARREGEERRAFIGAINASQRRSMQWGLWGSAVGVLVAWGLGLISVGMTLLLLGALACGWTTLRRDYLRSVLLFYSRPLWVLYADIAYSVLLVLGAWGATFSASAAVLWAIGTRALAGMAGVLLGERAVARDPGWARGDTRSALREIRPLGTWSAIGALTYWVFGQSYNYLLAGQLDLKAVADVNATRLMLMPIVVLTVGVQDLLRPSTVLWHAQLGLKQVTRRLLRFLLGMAVLDAGYLVVIWCCRDWLTGTVLHKQIAMRDLLLILWGVVALIGLAREVLQCALFALGRMKPMAAQTALAAVVALAVMEMGIRWWGAPAMVIGLTAGELVNLVGIALLLREAQRRPERAGTEPLPQPPPMAGG